MEVWIFYLFASITIASGVMVVSSRSPVQAVLFLIVAFFSVAGLFLLLGAEFLAMILVVVYVGAVAVLFLFIVMMLAIDASLFRRQWSAWLPAIGLAGGLLATELAALWMADVSPALLPSGDKHVDKSLSNTHQLGQILYTDNFYAFQITGMILLVAMIGAIVLTLRHRDGVKRQDVASQNSLVASDRVRLVKVETGKGIEE